ncbi:hypothetical protein BN3660_00346 [Eubacteriaceae bacterium CHKCI004]|nr:hypothetical protein BN3660_00346 [Eubacteriaceae bacterium CHKCI004]
MLILLKFALFWQGDFFTGGFRMTGAHKRKSSKKIQSMLREFTAISM